MTPERTSAGGLIALHAGDHMVLIDPTLGARIVSWTFGGQELLITDGPDPVEYGMYAMVPWAGRLRDNQVYDGSRACSLPVTHAGWAMHGTVLASRADTITTGATASFESHPGWPWPMRVELAYDLSPASLVTTITVTALREAMPAVVGWHPWFRRRLDQGESAHWGFTATGMAERGSDHLPTGRLVEADLAAGPFDDAFTVPDGRAHITWPGALTVEIAGDATWFVVYDHPEGSICLEPQSGPPDGLRAAASPHIVEPGSPWTWTTRWQVRDARPGESG